MRNETIKGIEARLAMLSEDAPEMKEIHWVHNDECGEDSEEDYCQSCAETIIKWYNGGAKPEGLCKHLPDWSGDELSISGACGYYEDDEPRACSLCGAELAILILSGDSELHYFSEHDPESSSAWRILARLFDLYSPYLTSRNPYPQQREYRLRSSRRNTARLMLILRRVMPPAGKE